MSYCDISCPVIVALAKCFIPKNVSAFNKLWPFHLDTKDIRLTQHSTLDLGNNNLFSRGAEVLGYGLKYCHKLESLNLCSNGTEAHSAKMLANGLTLCHSLQVLTMDDNPLGADGAAEIFSAIKSCSN